MGLIDRLAEWWLRRRARKAALAAAPDPVAARAALAHFRAFPAAADVTVPAPSGGNVLYTRADVPRLAAAVRKGTGERVVGGMLQGSASFGFPGGWSQDRVEQVMHFRHWVFCAVRAVCEEIAGLPPNVAWVRRTSPRGPRRRDWAAREWRYKKSLHAIRPHEEVEPVDPGHPLHRLLAAPNAWDTAGLADLLYELVMFLELTGNAYLWCVPSLHGRMQGTLQPCELFVFPSQWVWPRMGPSGVDNYLVQPIIGPGCLRFPAEEMVHFRYKSPLHKVDGWSPQQSGAETIDVTESILRSRFWANRNMVVPTGVVELDAQYEDVEDPELDRIYAKLNSRLQGVDNFRRLLVLTPGAKWNPVTTSAVDLDWMGGFEQCRDTTLALWRVPKEVVGIQDAGSEIAMYGPLLQFARYCVCPRLRYLGHVLTRCLASRYQRPSPDCELRIWWDDPAPENPEQRNKDLELQLKYGLCKPNEARNVFGLEPYTPEEEAKYYVKGGGKQPGEGGPGGLAPPPGLAPGKKGLRLRGGDFSEEEHPRADDGEFTSGTGGGTSGPGAGSSAGAGGDDSPRDAWQDREDARGAKADAVEDTAQGAEMEPDGEDVAFKAVSDVWGQDRTAEAEDAGAAYADLYQAHWKQTRAALAGHGATDDDLKTLDKVIDKAEDALDDAVVLHTDAADRRAKAVAALKAHEALEPQEPEYPEEPDEPELEDEPDEPDEPEEPDIGDEPERHLYGDAPEDVLEYETHRREYDAEVAAHDAWEEEHRAWEEEHGAWEKESARVEKENGEAQAGWEKEHDAWEAKRDRLEEKFNNAHDRWDEKRERLDEKADGANDAWSDRADEMRQEASDWHDKVGAAARAVADKLHERLGAERDDDPEPEEEEEDDETPPPKRLPANRARRLLHSGNGRATP